MARVVGVMMKAVMDVGISAGDGGGLCCLWEKTMMVASDAHSGRGDGNGDEADDGVQW